MLKTGAEALGSPGIDPRWARGDKDGIGTAYRSSSRVWFSIWNGILTEVYYPHVDKPQIRELIFSFTDGSTFFIDESSLNHRIERITEFSPSYRIISEDPNRRFRLIKEIITDNYAPSVIINVKIQHGENWNDSISSYFTIYPHIDGEGKNNHGYILHRNFDRIFIAERNGTYMAVKASSQFVKASVGYVGRSDGFTDLKETFNLSREFDNASSGNIAFTAKLLLHHDSGTNIILSFGNSQPTALSRLYQSLSVPFDFHLERFTSSWKRKLESILDLGKQSKDGGNLYRMSYSLIMSHEDKTHDGGIIASLSIPWGELSDDSNKGGYHLVWSRDLVNAATGLLAAGDHETPLRSLIYLSANQREDGSFPQNFWVNGEPYWNAVQLDQTAYPIILAYQLSKLNALKLFDARPLVYKAVSFLIKTGPVTQQDRWEENSGYSPATIAANIAGLVCAAYFAEIDNRFDLRDLFLSFADFLERNIEKWTVTRDSQICPDIKEHYVRINPADFDSPDPDEHLDGKLLLIKNVPPDKPNTFPANYIVSTGFLLLVRYGIRNPNDPLILKSVEAVDRILKTNTPYGPVWHRYNEDGYGQNADGSGFQGTGVGRGWPLLTGERAHYELAAGHDVSSYVETMERLASDTLMLPEQVWDREDIPEKHLFLGRKTGSATPLVWAHSEYIKLLRSISDNRVFDEIEEVKSRYITNRNALFNHEIWKMNRQVKQVDQGRPLRFILDRPFHLIGDLDQDHKIRFDNCRNTGIGLYFMDIYDSNLSGKTVTFKIYWLDTSQEDYSQFDIRFL